MLKNIYIRLLLRQQFESLHLRKLFKHWYKIEVGLYSYGCFDTKRIPVGTKIGRYCSFSGTCHFFSRNHGLKYIALHPYLYNSALGMVGRDTIAYHPCEVEDDVWIGHNAIITPGVTRIGRGAVVAAGAIVTRDVPPYAIVAGNPGKLVKYRFDPDIIKKIEATHWWEKSKDDLKKMVAEVPAMAFKPEQYFA